MGLCHCLVIHCAVILAWVGAASHCQLRAGALTIHCAIILTWAGAASQLRAGALAIHCAIILARAGAASQLCAGALASNTPCICDHISMGGGHFAAKSQGMLQCDQA